jgi:hypothetical protein
MLLDTTYARVCAIGDKLCLSCGVEEADLDQFLAEHGYAIQRRWKHRWYDGTKNEPWPPKPWADKHVALVWQTRDDSDAHYVVVDHRGTVYDPADTEFIPSKLDRYYDVEWVAAVHPVTTKKHK